MNEAQVVNRIVVESRIADIEKKLKEANELYPGSADVEELVREFQKIQEEISAGDWGRIGVIAGVLWYKLDALINHLSNIEGSLKNVERNTSKIK